MFEPQQVSSENQFFYWIFSSESKTLQVTKLKIRAKFVMFFSPAVPEPTYPCPILWLTPVARGEGEGKRESPVQDNLSAHALKGPL